VPSFITVCSAVGSGSWRSTAGSLSAVTDHLVTLVVAKLGAKLQVHGAYLLGTDTTLVAKTAKCMLGVQKWKDHSANADRSAYLVGHHWNLVGFISP